MPHLYRLYKAQQATIVHATATPYRERSHFDGQDVLESGLARPSASDSGRLDRALLALASDGSVDPAAPARWRWAGHPTDRARTGSGCCPGRRSSVAG